MANVPDHHNAAPRTVELLELRIEKDLVDRVETLWLQRSRLLFDARASRDDVNAAARRFAGLIAALTRPGSIHRERLAEHCLLEVQGPFLPRVTAALIVLLTIAPAISRGRSLREARKGSFAVLDALRHAGMPKVSADLHPLDLDAASFRAPATGDCPMRGFCLAGAFVPMTRRAALVAAARGRLVSPTLVSEMRREVSDGATAMARSLALYALGLADPEGFDDVVARVSGLEAIPHAAFLLGVFGARRSLRTLLAWYAMLPDPRVVRAIGMLGYAEGRDAIQDALGRGVGPLAVTAAVACWELSGALPWKGRFELHQGEPDRTAAERALAALETGGLQLRQGLPLAAMSDRGSVTAQWLQNVRTRRLEPIRLEHPDGLFGEGYGGLLGPFDLGAEERAVEPLTRSPWILDAC